MTTPDPLTVQPAPPFANIPIPPVPQSAVDAASQWGAMLTNMYSAMLQLNTQVAVMQATVANTDRQVTTIKHEFDARLRELEQARIQELTTMGAVRADVVERTGNAASKAISGDLSLMQQLQARNAQMQTVLIGAGCSLVTAILVLVIGRMI